VCVIDPPHPKRKKKQSWIGGRGVPSTRLAEDVAYELSEKIISSLFGRLGRHRRPLQVDCFTLAGRKPGSSCVEIRVEGHCWGLPSSWTTAVVATCPSRSHTINDMQLCCAAEPEPMEGGQHRCAGTGQLRSAHKLFSPSFGTPSWYKWNLSRD